MSETTSRERSGVPTHLRERVLERDNHTCQYCGDSIDGDAKELQAHHVIPDVEGGEDSMDNLVTLCQRCHGQLHGTYTGAKEFPIELLDDVDLRERTPERDDVRPIECQGCGYQWDYTGDKSAGMYTGCPNCPTQARIRKKKTMEELFTFGFEEIVREKAREEGFDPEAMEVSFVGVRMDLNRVSFRVEGVSREGFGEVEWNGETYSHGDGPNGREVRIPEEDHE